MGAFEAGPEGGDGGGAPDFVEQGLGEPGEGGGVESFSEAKENESEPGEPRVEATVAGEGALDPVAESGPLEDAGEPAGAKGGGLIEGPEEREESERRGIGEADMNGDE